MRGAVQIQHVSTANEEDRRLWAMDGLQVLMDPARGGGRKLGKIDISMGVGAKGPQAWSHLTADPAAPTGEAQDITVEYQRGKNGNITYEIAIPWQRLTPITAKTGANLGIAVALNEADGGVRGACMGWFSGVHLKETDMIGHLILVE